MKYKLIIFDMDGLMFDTEKIYYETWFKFQDKYAFTFSEELRKKFTGKNEAGIRDELVNLLGSLDKVKSLRKDLEADRIESLKAYRGSIKKEGLDDLLEFLRAEKIKCALASSNDRNKIDLLLKKENIYDYFDFIISGENVEKSKPDPEIFVKAKDAFEFSNEECLILEDSYNGYKAAQKSAMDYLIIHDSSFDKYFTADREVDNLRSVIAYIK